MNIYQRQIFGTKKGATSFNTEIGGVSATISSASALATKLGISSSRVADFTIVGSDIKCNITGGTYTIPGFSFNGNTAITHYIDSDNLVTAFGGGVFLNATNLATAIFNGLITVSASSFYGCTNLITGSFNKVTSIAADGFRACSKMTSYSFPELLTINGNNAFLSNSLLVTFSAPKLTTITGSNGNTFQNNTALVTFSAPLLVLTNNNGGVFAGNSNLQYLTIAPPTGIGTSAFASCSKIVTIDLSNCSVIASFAFNGCLLLGNFTSNNVTSVGSDAFYNCQSITSYSFPALTTLTSTNVGTFRNNYALVSFSAPNLVTTAGTRLFYDATSLVSCYMPLLATLGATTGDNNNFQNIKTGATITVAASLATANAGAPDGDLVYASGTRGATIVYV